ncbi:MAG: CBS domain-containing protein [Candidatus Latescibacteria bacterium]|nr:CBS domain-containing protein [Candidatus Latescibacterota bacterium]
MGSHRRGAVGAVLKAVWVLATCGLWVRRLGGLIGRQFDFDRSARIYLYSAGVGVIAGLAAVAFTYGLELTKFVLVEYLAGFPQQHSGGYGDFDFSFLGQPVYAYRTWLLLLLPALGAGIGGYLVYRWAPEAEGAGAAATIDAFHNRRGLVRPIVPLVKALATIATLGSGGSAGKQGPLAQIGAGLGSWVGTRLKLAADQRRILLLAGTAGGLGAIFRAPLGGAITSVEILYRRDFESSALIPCIISSIVAYSLYLSIFGFSHVFSMPDLRFTDVRELAFYLLLGLLCALVGMVYVRFFNYVRRHFDGVALPRYMVAALGGLLVGAIGLLDVRSLGGGFWVIQEGLDGRLGLQAFAVLALLKMISSSCTVGSGGSGGLFGPSLFIGSMLGGAVGMVGHQYFPDIVQQPAAYMVVGMASFFAGVANTPLAALIIVTEMTGSYHLLPPLMLVCALALIFARRYSIYRNQVENRFHSPAHVKNFTVDILQNLQVSQVMSDLAGNRQGLVRNDLSYFDLRQRSRALGLLHFVVTDGQGRLRGMLRMDDLDLPEDDFLRPLILIEDMFIENVESIELDDDLHQALQKLLDGDFDILPVVRRGELNDEVLGYMSYQDLLAAYHQEVGRLDGSD